MRVVIYRFITLMLLSVVSCVSVDASDPYRSDYLGAYLQSSWEPIREWRCPEAGVYAIFYNVKMINQEYYTIAANLELRVNGALVEYTGQNITVDGHYWNPSMSWVGVVNCGDIVSVNGKVSSSRGVREKSVVIPYEVDGNHRIHESMSIIRIDGNWFQSHGFLE